MKHTKWVKANNIQVDGTQINQGVIALPNSGPPILIAITRSDEVSKLIAAAPEMLEALKAYSILYWETDFDKINGGRFTNLNKKVKDILKQIEG